MNRGQRATRNNPANQAKPFVSGGVISNFTGATQNPPEPVAPVQQQPTSNFVSNLSIYSFNPLKK